MEQENFLELKNSEDYILIIASHKSPIQKKAVRQPNQS